MHLLHIWLLLPSKPFILHSLDRISHTIQSMDLRLNLIVLSFFYVLLRLYLTMQHSEKGMLHGCLLDHHFNRIDSQAELLALGNGICDSAAAVGHLCVKVHPAARLRLCH